MSPQPVWLRKWELSTFTVGGDGSQVLKTKLSSSDFGNETLKMRFDVGMVSCMSALWYGDIEIFNVDAATTEMLLLKDMVVKLSAGFENGPFSEIFTGTLFQAFWERENVVDFKITMHCVVGMDEIVDNVVSKSMGPMADQKAIIYHIAENAMTKLEVSHLSKQIDSTIKLPRGATYFGTAEKYLDQIAADNNMQFFFDGTGIKMGYATRPDPDPDADPDAEADTALVYTPETIIDTPQQTERGVAFRVMLDSRVKVDWPPTKVKIDNSSIRMIKAQVGSEDIAPRLNQDNEYYVLSVRHIGDTRGQEWYTEIVATIDSAEQLLGGFQGN